MKATFVGSFAVRAIESVRTARGKVPLNAIAVAD